MGSTILYGTAINSCLASTICRFEESAPAANLARELDPLLYRECVVVYRKEWTRAPLSTNTGALVSAR